MQPIQFVLLYITLIIVTGLTLTHCFRLNKQKTKQLILQSIIILTGVVSIRFNTHSNLVEWCKFAVGSSLGFALDRSQDNILTLWIHFPVGMFVYWVSYWLKKHHPGKLKYLPIIFAIFFARYFTEVLFLY